MILKPTVEMLPRIENLTEKKLIGKRLKMSLANNRTGELWASFIPKRKNISNHLSNDLISMQVYPSTHFSDFNPVNSFEKWATVEVSDFDNVPNDLEKFILQGGLYAVFDYKGLSNDSSIFQYIFGIWLPNSDYILDDRPHFEILGEKYKNNDPDSEEEIWIPIRHNKNTNR
jgi:AraC family transcriptional regulator